jgi:hypothetical protein
VAVSLSRGVISRRLGEPVRGVRQDQCQ